jgi:hypothetical protein
MKKLIIIPLILLIHSISFSQNNESLNTRWDKMLNKSSTFENYKVIKKTELADFWKFVQDSVSTLKSQLVQERTLIAKQKSEIDQLQKQSVEVNSSLESTRNEKDTMTFMGMDVDKYSYATTLWIFIFLILAGCGALFYMFQNSNKVTSQKTSDYESLNKSFEEFKQNKIEVERKLKREIQTQMNKIEELKSSSGRR